ncbi:MAG: hypothetical protein LBV27_11070 [Oscillospiraceae bacterium]|jgi:hypothetical protein|nr:hypothetical protein [Oscillospiraceae bacterium]
MKKTIIMALACGLIGLTACESGNNGSSSAPGESAQQMQSRQSEISMADESGPEGQNLPVEEGYDPLDGLVENEYDGLKMTAEVLERKAILPGSGIPVTVIIENTGDQTIAYTQGSGSFETPQAIFARADKLQVVLPEDHLGPATMDYVVKELAPGENLKFVLYVMAIKPHEEFDAYTYEMGEKDQYIADMEWSQLEEAYPELESAEPGTYDVHVYFTYSIMTDAQQPALLSGPTGYAQADVQVGVTA